MILGTAVKITTVITVYGGGTPSSVKIDIYDPEGTQKITAQSMTSAGGGEYYYIYQSSTSNEPGKYKAIIKAVSGSYTGSSKSEFSLDDP